MGLCPRALQLKQMEVQLEEEYEDKQKVLREKRELESKLATLSDQVSVTCWRGPANGLYRPALGRPSRGYKAGNGEGDWAP